jgi:hypothetical protein
MGLMQPPFFGSALETRSHRKPLGYIAAGLNTSAVAEGDLWDALALRGRHPLTRNVTECNGIAVLLGGLPKLVRSLEAHREQS